MKNRTLNLKCCVEMKRERKILVYLADLRHDYQGVMSTDAMPLAVGYMKAVMDRELTGQVESHVFAYPKNLQDAIDDCVPDVLLLTNYMWNEQLSLRFASYLKSIKPGALVVLGGPNIPLENERKITYFRSLKHVDIYCTGEGDFYAAKVVKWFIEDKLRINKFLKRTIDSSIYIHDNQDVVLTPIQPRERNLEEIPSPWLTGVMDKFFDGKMVPLFETNRGCPFTCSFCVQGTHWYHRVNHFGLERMKAEVFYIGKMMHEKCPEQKMLRIADPNFGMYDRDIEISSYLGETQVKYKWPLFIDATTGKNRAKNIIKSIEKVNGALIMYQAVQSLDEDVLDHIKRKNIRLDTYEEVQVYIRGRGLRSSSDLILGLPSETLDSHLNSLRKIINSGTHKLNNFQSMMLKGAELETLEQRKHYGFKTKFRLLPKNFGEYCDAKVFDIDEIITETNTLSFDEYLDARKYHFLISVFWNESRFERIARYLQRLGYDAFTMVQAIYDYLLLNEHPFGAILDDFVSETKGELFDSPEEVEAYYSQPQNFERALKSEIGDNLMYKYRAIMSFWHWDLACDTIFNAVHWFLKKNNNAMVSEPNWQAFYSDWHLYTKMNHSYGKSDKEMLEEKSANFEYNISEWIKDVNSLDADNTKFEAETKVVFSVSDANKELLKGAFRIWDYELSSLPMVVKRIHNTWQVREVKEINMVTN